MSRMITRLAAAALAVTALTACGSTSGSGGSSEIDAASCPDEATTPVEGDTITVATTGPLSGQLAIIGQLPRAVEAYFDFKNESGGVETADGKKNVDVLVYDDQYTASKTQSAVREAVEQDGAIATIAVLGTAANQAVAPYLDQRCVPQMWVSAGSVELLSEDLPFVSEVITYHDQAVSIGKYITEQDPEAKIAVLHSNDDNGLETLEGLTTGLGGDENIVATESYEATDTSIKSQMTTLAASGATHFFNASVGNVCTQAFSAISESDWDTDVYLNDMCNESSLLQAPADSVDRVFRSVYQQPTTSDSEGMVQYREVMEKAGLEISNTTLLGYSYAMMLEKTINEAKEVSSVGLAEAARDLSSAPPEPSVYAEGIEFDPGRGQAAINAYRVGQWDPASKTFQKGLTEPIPVQD